MFEDLFGDEDVVVETLDGINDDYDTMDVYVLPGNDAMEMIEKVSEENKVPEEGEEAEVVENEIIDGTPYIKLKDNPAEKHFSPEDIEKMKVYRASMRRKILEMKKELASRPGILTNEDVVQAIKAIKKAYKEIDISSFAKAYRKLLNLLKIYDIGEIGRTRSRRRPKRHKTKSRRRPRRRPSRRTSRRRRRLPSVIQKNGVVYVRTKKGWRRYSSPFASLIKWNYPFNPLDWKPGTIVRGFYRATASMGNLAFAIGTIGVIAYITPKIIKYIGDAVEEGADTYAKTRIAYRLSK